MGAAENDTRLMCVLILMAQILCFVGFANADYGEYTPASYEMYLGVALMMVVGFGYLMTFLKQYGLGAVGFTFIITSLAVQINIFLAALIPDSKTPIIDSNTLMDGNFSAAVVLISFGCLIGKASPAQLVVLTVVESVIFQVCHVPPPALSDSCSALRVLPMKLPWLGWAAACRDKLLSMCRFRLSRWAPDQP